MSKLNNLHDGMLDKQASSTSGLRVSVCCQRISPFRGSLQPVLSSGPPSLARLNAAFCCASERSTSAWYRWSHECHSRNDAAVGNCCQSVNSPWTASNKPETPNPESNMHCLNQPSPRKVRDCTA
eukprot:CAMPEP_0172680356 /NCGR_PEP_ID=MMETSP1074-20121228/16716_1 /TAXON_ID=2916 /ORGANISM="Ceratium fusus, Strain PA161109" /LENGTH=124 /DNA_ID=CAMNT_0013498679 /DNA_START=123 /DNA_END=497 /DNA_ORIENTATION=+